MVDDKLLAGKFQIELLFRDHTVDALAFVVAFGNDPLIRQVTSRRAHSAMGKPSKRTNLVKNESLPTQTCKAVIFGFDAPADPFVQYQLTERSTLPKSFA